VDPLGATAPTPRPRTEAVVPAFIVTGDDVPAGPPGGGARRSGRGSRQGPVARRSETAAFDSPARASSSAKCRCGDVPAGPWARGAQRRRDGGRDRPTQPSILPMIWGRSANSPPVRSPAGAIIGSSYPIRSPRDRFPAPPRRACRGESSGGAAIITKGGTHHGSPSSRAPTPRRAGTAHRHQWLGRAASPAIAPTRGATVAGHLCGPAASPPQAGGVLPPLRPWPGLVIGDDG